MLPVLPNDLLHGGFEVVCYGFTIVAAFVSWFFVQR